MRPDKIHLDIKLMCCSFCENLLGMSIEIHLKTNKEVSPLINISLAYLLWKTSGNNERVEQEGKWKLKLWKRCLLSTMCRMSLQSTGRVPLFFKVCIR